MIDQHVDGSAALAVRGVDVGPGDVDLVTDDDDAVRLGAAMVDHLIEPVCDVDWISRRWGRAWLGCRVPPLDLANAVNARRGRVERVAAIERYRR